MLTVIEHHSAHYAPRTWHNAKVADVTIAFAVRFDTAGERLTRRAAGDRYLHAELSAEPEQVAAVVVSEMRGRKARTVNVAGNGMQSLSAAGWTQERVDAWVFAVLERIHAKIGLQKIVCGGQTGVDLSGAAAGVALGVPTEVTMPKGHLQRTAAGVDFMQSREDVERCIHAAAEQMRLVVHDDSPSP